MNPVLQTVIMVFAPIVGTAVARRFIQGGAKVTCHSLFQQISSSVNWLLYESIYWTWNILWELRYWVSNVYAAHRKMKKLRDKLNEKIRDIFTKNSLWESVSSEGVTNSEAR